MIGSWPNLVNVCRNRRCLRRAHPLPFGFRERLQRCAAMRKGRSRLGSNTQKQHCRYFGYHLPTRFSYRLPTVRYSQPNLYPIQRGSNTVAAVFSVLNPRWWHRGSRSNLAGQELQTSFSPWPFIEDGTQSLAIEPQTESVFLGKLRDLCLSICLVWRPETFQFVLVNSAVLPFANLQFAFDSARKRLHTGVPNVRGE